MKIVLTTTAQRQTPVLPILEYSRVDDPKSNTVTIEGWSDFQTVEDSGRYLSCNSL